MNRIEVTPADIQQLASEDELFAVKLQNVALRRRVLELEKLVQEAAEKNNGKKAPDAVPADPGKVK